ncbi:conserved hypothetical protein [Ricinus communis]|uniref:Uncharacterized protein n=1 Tax=Ricinus communis TaxID=3988 RepID=B9SGA9_RICCO|nr:conserved hypothetical protein [Ricinus communis]
MVRKEKLFIALTWFLVVMSIAICANATAGPRLQTSEHMVQPQAGCRCCFFIGRIPNIRCGNVCCEDGCCSSN